MIPMTNLWMPTCAPIMFSPFSRSPYSRACECTEQKSCSAERGDTADNAGCNAVHLVHVSCFHVAHSCLCAEDITNDTRADSTYQICLNCCIYNIHTG